MMVFPIYDSSWTGLFKFFKATLEKTQNITNYVKLMIFNLTLLNKCYSIIILRAQLSENVTDSCLFTFLHIYHEPRYTHNETHTSTSFPTFIYYLLRGTH